MTSFTARRLAAAPFMEIYKKDPATQPVRIGFSPRMISTPGEIKFAPEGERFAAVTSAMAEPDDLYEMTDLGIRVWSRDEKYLLLGGNNTNRPRLYSPVFNAMRNEPTSPVLPALGTFIVHAAFNEDARYLAVVTSDAQSQIKIYKRGLSGFALLTTLSLSGSVSMLMWGNFNTGHDVLVASSGTSTTAANNKVWRRYPTDPDTFVDQTTPGNARILGIDQKARVIFTERQVSVIKESTPRTGYIDDVVWLYAEDGTITTGALNVYPSAAANRVMGPTTFYRHPVGNVIILVQPGFGSADARHRFSPTVVHTVRVAGTTRTVETVASMQDDSSLDLASYDWKNDWVAVPVFSPNNPEEFILTWNSQRGLGGNRAGALRKFGYRPSVTTIGYQANNVTSVPNDPFPPIITHPNFDANAQGGYHDFTNTATGQKFRYRERYVNPTPANTPGAQIPSGTGILPYAADLTYAQISGISYSPTGKFAIYNRTVGTNPGFYLSKGTGGVWADATVVEGTFVGIYEVNTAKTEFEMLGYYELPDETVVKDIVWSAGMEALALQAKNATVPAVDGRHVLRIDEFGAVHGVGIEYATAARSKFSFSPADPLVYFAAIPDGAGSGQDIELFKFAANQVSYTNPDEEPSLFGPISFSNCDDIVVAHGATGAPFTFYKRTGDTLKETLLEGFDGLTVENVIDIKWLPDCGGLVVLTPDEVILIETDEEEVPDPDNPGQTIPKQTVTNTDSTPISSSANDGSGGDGTSASGDPSGVTVGWATDGNTGLPVLSVVVDRNGQDVNSDNSRSDTAGLPVVPAPSPTDPVPVPDPGAYEKPPTQIDIPGNPGDRNLVDRTYPFFVNVNVGWEH